jgi:ABC-type branched-subunit amino acid transport system substrate-binding protein
MFKRAAEWPVWGYLPAPALLCLLSLLLLPLSGCREDRPLRVDPVVKIGLVAPFEGRNRDVGYDVIYSARLAIRQENERRGPGQVRLALVALDDFGDPTMARESAEAAALDPGIIAVIGHWLPETTATAKPIYEAAGLPFVAAGDGPLGMIDPAGLDTDFLQAYENVTPFDETAGPYAGTAYDGVNLIIAALREVENSGRDIERVTIGEELESLSYSGISGTVWQP